MKVGASSGSGGSMCAGPVSGCSAGATAGGGADASASDVSETAVVEPRKEERRRRVADASVEAERIDSDCKHTQSHLTDSLFLTLLRLLSLITGNTTDYRTRVFFQDAVHLRSSPRYRNGSCTRLRYLQLLTRAGDKRGDVCSFSASLI